MKKLYYILFFCVFAVSNACACFNDYYMLDKDGHARFDVRRLEMLQKNFNQEEVVKKLKELGLKFQLEKSYTLLSDYALLLIKLGKKAEALKIFQELYNHFPNEYKLAANLGTTYELNGMNREALTYIKRGIELNPNAHGGSEWVHVKILETKVLMETDPLYLEKNSVLQLTEAQKRDTATLRHIGIQMHERFPFSPGPDKIMASIFNDLGDCYFFTNGVENARVAYDIAKQYYGASADLINPKIKMINDIYTHLSDKDIIRNMGQYSMSLDRKSNYLNRIEDNSIKDYTVDWSKIESDPQVLLSNVNYRIPQAILQKTVEVPIGEIRLIPSELRKVTHISNKKKQVIGHYRLSLIFTAIAVLMIFVRMRR